MARLHDMAEAVRRLANPHTYRTPAVYQEDVKIAHEAADILDSLDEPGVPDLVRCLFLVAGGPVCSIGICGDAARILRKLLTEPPETPR